MVKRKIIQIDEDKCNGCGLCIPDCPEGALQIIDGKARLVSDLFCDGLGACIGSCSKNAIKIIEREATPYNERKVMERIVKQGKNVIKAHIKHLKEHGEKVYLKEALDYLKEKGIENPLQKDLEKELPCGCPGSKVMVLKDRSKGKENKDASKIKQSSELKQWPVQLMLVPQNAPFFDNANLLIAADCVPFTYPNFHQDFLKGKSIVIGCPKLDDIEFYREKLTEILKLNNIRSVTVVHMEVPCCYGLQNAVKDSVNLSDKKIRLKQVIVGINGVIKSRR